MRVFMLRCVRAGCGCVAASGVHATRVGVYVCACRGCVTNSTQTCEANPLNLWQLTQVSA